MAFFGLNLPFSSRRNDVQQDQQFYQGFVTGLAFDSLRYANKQCEAYAELLEQGKALPADWYPRLLENYGDLLEEDEEDELRMLFDQKNLIGVVTRLRAIEQRYETYYLEQVDNRLQTVDVSFGEAKRRTGFSMNYAIAEDIHTEYTQQNLPDLARLVRNLKERIYPTTLANFHQVTYRPVEHHVRSNKGQNDDAELLWENTIEELNRKIRYGPVPPAGYQWYLKKSLMSSFFLEIARKRWLDALRKRKSAPHVQFNEQIIPAEEGETFLEKIAGSQAVDKALTKLGEPCASIIQLRWIEEKSLDEVAQRINRSYGYVRTLHSDCFNKFSLLVKKYLELD